MNNKNEFKEKFNIIKNIIIENEDKKKNEYQIKDLSFVSANLRNFYPFLSTNQHEKIYRNILLTRGMLVAETNYFEIYDKLIQENNICFNSYKNDSKIFCTFHLGSYRAIIGLLAKNGLDFVLIVDNNTYNTQGDDIRNLVTNIRKNFNIEGFFEIIDAERPDIVIILTQYLKKNINIVAYLDGNTGVGGIYNKNAELLKINFLNKEIFVRKGIAYISYVTKKDIVPVISYYKNFEHDAPNIEFAEEISPKNQNNIDIQTYSKKTTIYLWKILENNLKLFIDQWEGWLYIHKYLEFKENALLFDNINQNCNCNTKSIISLNLNEYEIFKIEEDSYILNKSNYAIKKITKELFKILASLRNVNISYQNILSSQTNIKYLIDDLLKKNVVSIIE